MEGAGKVPTIGVFNVFSTVVAVVGEDNNNHIVDTRTGSRLIAWSGAEAVAVCVHGNGLFVVDYSGRFLWLDGASAEELVVSTRQSVYTTCVSVSSNEVLLAGTDGCYGVFSMNTRTESQSNLASSSIALPTRNILRVKSVDSGIHGVGLRELLVRFQQRPESLLAQEGTTNTVLFDAASFNAGLVVSGSANRLPMLGVYDPGERRILFERVDLEPPTFPRVLSLGGELLVYSVDRILVGVPSRWRILKTFPGDRLVGIVEDERGQLVAYLKSERLVTL